MPTAVNTKGLRLQPSGKCIMQRVFSEILNNMVKIVDLIIVRSHNSLSQKETLNYQYSMIQVFGLYGRSI